MDQILGQFFSLETIIFCIVVYIAVLVTRRLVETSAKYLSKYVPEKYSSNITEVWREWVLPVLPMLIGALLAFAIVAYPFPAIFAVSVSGRVFFGIVSGMASGYVYRFFKYYSKKLLPEAVQNTVDNFDGNVGEPKE